MTMTPDELGDRADAELARQKTFKERLHCCTAASCQSCGGDAVKAALLGEVKAKGREREVEVVGTGCLGLCSKGPLVKRERDDALFVDVKASDA